MFFLYQSLIQSKKLVIITKQIIEGASGQEDRSKWLQKDFSKHCQKEIYKKKERETEGEREREREREKDSTHMAKF